MRKPVLPKKKKPGVPKQDDSGGGKRKNKERSGCPNPRKKGKGQK